MDQESRRLIASVEMLMPAEHRDGEGVSRFPIVTLVFDDAVAFAGKNVLDLLVKMAVGSGPSSGGDLGQESRHLLHVKADARIDDVGEPAHSGLLEFNVLR